MNTILNELTTELNNLRWSKSNNKKYGRKSLNVARTDGEEEPDRFYFITGLVRAWSMRAYNNYTQSLVISKATGLKKHQRVIELATNYMALYNPSFQYTSIQFSKCMLTPRHVDKNNVGDSIILGCGTAALKSALAGSRQKVPRRALRKEPQSDFFSCFLNENEFEIRN